jgi:hypothetical protein
MVFRMLTTCRCCKSEKLLKIGSFGSHPLTGVFLSDSNLSPPHAPLELITCESCKLLQLAHLVDREEMYRTYFYRSGMNQTMTGHLESLAADISNEFLPESGMIIDTGCNDGTFLLAIKDRTAVRIGVDPSNSVSPLAGSDVIVVNDYFPSTDLDKIVDERKADVITSISMFYDINDPNDFITSVCRYLADDGVWIIEMNYTGDMLSNAAFDMISHEHVTYYTLETFSNLLQHHGLSVFRVTRNKINGGSIRIFCSRSRSPEGSVSELISYEKSSGLNEIKSHLSFYDRCLEFRELLREAVMSRKEAGHELATYGASTRGNMILQFCGFTTQDFKFAVDRNPEKVGRYCPGSNIPIVSEDFFRNSDVDVALVLPYGFLEEFLSREAHFIANGGEFLIPFPILSSIVRKPV